MDKKINPPTCERSGHLSVEWSERGRLCLPRGQRGRARGICRQAPQDAALTSLPPQVGPWATQAQESQKGPPSHPQQRSQPRRWGEPHSRTAFDLSVAPLALTSMWEGNPGAPVYPCRGDLPQLPMTQRGFPPVCRLLKQITVGRPPKDRLVSHNLQGHIYPHIIPRAPWSPGGWQQAGWAIRS